MKEILREICNNVKVYSKIDSIVKKQNILLYEDIISKTSFVDNNNKFTERIYCYLNNIKKIPTCNCGQQIKFLDLSRGYQTYCSKKCLYLDNKNIRKKLKEKWKLKYGTENPFQLDEIKKKKKQTCLEKYGVDNPCKCDKVLKKIRITNQKKYGVDFYAQTDEYKKKSKQTCLEKYGETTNLKTNECKEKIKQTCLKKYGVEHALQSEIIKTKSKQTCLEKYGVSHFSKTKDWKEKTEETNFKKYGNKYHFLSNKYTHLYKELFYNSMKMWDCAPCFSLEEYVGVDKDDYIWECKTCKNKFTQHIKNGNRPVCKICHPVYSSKQQTEIVNFINKYFSNILINTHNIIQPKELDIYIPQKNIAIEYNGHYFHSENNLFGPKLKSYHLNKTKLCEEQGIRLIHIFEDEWLFKQQIVKARLKHILGKTKYKIYGRKCIIKEIDIKTKNKFLNKYHIQGEDKSKIKLGCFYKNRLIAVMTFGKRKITGAKKLEWELIRYATVANFNCIGVAGKLLKHFERNYTPEKIITYADRRWSQGNMYKQLGFQLSHTSPPNYWYLDNTYLKRYNRVFFQKHKLKNTLKQFNNNKSEWENMIDNGHDRIWDCGNYVFTKNC